MMSGDNSDRDALKSNDALRSIGEASQELGIKPHILRYWEQQIPALAPLKRAGGRRHYRPEDMALLRQIDSLVNHQGYTISGACMALNKPLGARQTTEPQQSNVHSTFAKMQTDSHKLGLPDNARMRLLSARARLESMLADLG